MSRYRVYMRNGWRVGDGAHEHGPYPTHAQAVITADNLNLRRRIEEQRSFAPEPAAGDRHDVRTVGQGAAAKVVHGQTPDHPMPPHMVSETRGGEPDLPIGDVVEFPNGPDVWEALETPAGGEGLAEDEAARIERARVSGGDGPAAGSQSRGGGLV